MERREYSREFKIEAVRRMRAGESATRLAEELGIKRKLLYKWKERVRVGGEEGVEGKPGRPSKPDAERREQTANRDRQRIMQLERLVGRQQALIVFFERALQAVEELPKSEAGKAPSTTVSGERGSKKR